MLGKKTVFPNPFAPRQGHVISSPHWNMNRNSVSCFYIKSFKRKGYRGSWLAQLNVCSSWFQLRSWSHGSWDWSPCWVLHSQCGACFRFSVSLSLCPSLRLIPLPLALSSSPSLKINKLKKKVCILLTASFFRWQSFREPEAMRLMETVLLITSGEASMLYC